MLILEHENYFSVKVGTLTMELQIPTNRSIDNNSHEENYQMIADVSVDESQLQPFGRSNGPTNDHSHLLFFQGNPVLFSDRFSVSSWSVVKRLVSLEQRHGDS